MPANLVFRRKIWGARDNGILPRSTPDVGNHLQPSILRQIGVNETMPSVGIEPTTLES